MNDRFSEELFLTNETGKMLYHKYAEHMPIIDYHCHLQPEIGRASCRERV